MKTDDFIQEEAEFKAKLKVANLKIKRSNHTLIYGKDSKKIYLKDLRSKIHDITANFIKTVIIWVCDAKMPDPNGNSIILQGPDGKPHWEITVKRIIHD